MNLTPREQGHARLLSHLGMPPHVKEQFDAVAHSGATQENLADLAEYLTQDTPPRQLELIIATLLAAVFPMAHSEEGAR